MCINDQVSVGIGGRRNSTEFYAEGENTKSCMERSGCSCSSLGDLYTPSRNKVVLQIFDGIYIIIINNKIIP